MSETKSAPPVTEPSTSQSSTNPPKDSALPDKVTLKVNGQERLLTAAEVIAEAQKQLAGDDKLRQAAEREKAAEEKIRQAESAIQLRRGLELLNANPNDPEGVRAIAGALGVTEAEVRQQLAANATPKPPAASHVGNPSNGPISTKIGLGDLDPEISKFIKESFEDKVSREIKHEVANDPVIGQYSRSEQGAKATEKLLRKAVKERLQQRVVDSFGKSQTREYGPDVLQEAVQEVRQNLTDLGIPASTNRLPSPGVGRVPQGTPSRTTNPKNKRPPSNSPEYAEWFQNRLTQLTDD